MNKIPIENIRPCPDNPNSHTPESIATLSANIREFGLINPIMVRPIIKDGKHNGKYEVVAGAGRLRAYETLWKEAKGNKQTQEWAEIPAVISNDQSDWGNWGRRLSENRLRSFNWAAECVCFARMKTQGRGWEEIAELFGLKSQDDVLQRIAIGNIPGIEKLQNVVTGHDVSVKEAAHYILPLRIETGRNPDNGNERLYDYSEVTTAIEKLVSGELTKEGLPAYSMERRLAIQQARDVARMKEIASQQVTLLKQSVAEKDAKLKEAQAAIAAETKRIQDDATKKAEKLKSDYEKKIKAVTAEITAAQEKISGAGDKEAELQKRIDELTEDRNGYEGQVIDLENKIESLREQVELEVAEKVRAEMIDQLREEIQAEKNTEAEQEISDSYENLAEEQAALDKQRQQMAKEKERLKKKVAELEEEQRRLQEQKEKAAQLQDINGWISTFNRLSDEYIFLLGVANSKQYWTLMEKPELKRIMSSLSGVGDELRKIETHFSSRGLLEGNG